ncbi:MAG TPA: BrnT family toxin [Chloroflexota bacterium]|nr:BrnT family toxin [Chloroflexota bacterium]
MPDFEWDDGNVDHVARHGVSPGEAEEALADSHRVGTGAYNAGCERRSAVIGATEDGRILLVVYTWRRDSIRVVTARDADQAQKRRYRR